MKRSDICKAYEAMTPTPLQKDKIFRQILEASAGAPQKTKPAHTKSRFFSQITAAAALFVLILTSSFAIGRTIQEHRPIAQNPDASVDSSENSAIPAAYGRIIATCRAAVSADWDEAQCNVYQISTRFAETEYARANAGYQILDLDGNGTDELILAQGDTLWDLYTLDGEGTVVQLLSDSNDGTIYHLQEDGRITKERNTKTEGYFDRYVLKGDELVQELSIYGLDTSYRNLLNDEMISSDEALDMIYSYDRQSLQLSYFYEIPDFLRAGNASLERYQQTLETYRTALAENWTYQRCKQSDISPQILNETTDNEKLGWYLLDLDGNGVEELIISDGEHLFDLYTLREDADKPVHVLSGDPYDYSLCYDGTICRWMSSGNFTYWSWFRFSEEDYAEEAKLIYDSEKNQYSIVVGDQDPKLIPKEEAGTYLKHELQLSLIPFLEKKSSTETVYDPIAETYDPEQKEQYAVSAPPQKEPYGYAEHIAWLIPWREEQFDDPQPLYYYFYDWNLDGIEDMILGYEKEVLSLWSYLYDSKSNTEHLFTLTVSDSELEELNAAWLTWDIRLITEFTEDP